jgi:hypothetical protein
MMKIGRPFTEAGILRAAYRPVTTPAAVGGSIGSVVSIMCRLITWSAIALAPALGLAQPDWERVGRLRAGETVTVHLRSGETLKGKLKSAGAEGIALAEKDGGTIRAAREDIARVTKRSRWRGAMWGGVFGFGIAAPVGAYAGPYIVDWGNPSAGVRLRHGAGWGLPFGGIGAGIGALAGGESTVYSRPATKSDALPHL